ncbi:MAG: hypothetical protein EHM70_05310 [Chloroflexota bacterium]|nr:MAG: hypothetical protein EHM70_05310 [Chloroflexota bacterium]
MLFRAKAAAKTWDTCAFYHRGVFYLYYLIAESCPGEGLGVATSTDGVIWEDLGLVITHSDQMVRYLGSGSICKAAGFEQTGSFLCNYSEWRKEEEKNVQNILFASSTDLIHWKKFPNDTIFKIDERYYKKIDVNAQWVWQDPRWEGISVIPKSGGGYYGFWTATPKDGFSFGFGISEDGLHWQALQPPIIEWEGDPCMRFIEVGGVWQFGSKYYAMLGDYASDHCGMFSFVAGAPGGPYRLASKNFELLRNQSRMHVYFSRFFEGPNGVLVNHHALAEGQFSDPHFVVYCSPFKRAIVHENALYLKWWEGNEHIKGSEIEFRSAHGDIIAYPKERGIILEGQMHLPGRLSIFTESGGEVILSINDQGIVEIGQHDLQENVVWEDRVDRQLTFGPAPYFRLLLNQTMLELYIEDYLIQCYTLARPPAGRLALENATGIRLWLWRDDID